MTISAVVPAFLLAFWLDYGSNGGLQHLVSMQPRQSVVGFQHHASRLQGWRFTKVVFKKVSKAQEKAMITAFDVGLANGAFHVPYRPYIGAAPIPNTFTELRFLAGIDYGARTLHSRLGLTSFNEVYKGVHWSQSSIIFPEFDFEAHIKSRRTSDVLKVEVPLKSAAVPNVLECAFNVTPERDPRTLLFLDHDIGFKGSIGCDDGGLVRLVGLQEGAPQEASGRNGEGKHSPLRNTVRSLKDKAKDSIILGLIAFAIIGVGGFILLAYGFMRAAEFLVEKVNCGKGQDPE